MYALSLKFGWGEEKIARLNEILDALVIIDINKPNVVDNYARINYFSEKVMKPARPMGQNDIWIAATAKTLSAWFMTTDNDFDHLHPKYLQRILISCEFFLFVVLIDKGRVTKYLTINFRVFCHKRKGNHKGLPLHTIPKRRGNPLWLPWGN